MIFDNSSNPRTNQILRHSNALQLIVFVAKEHQLASESLFRDSFSCLARSLAIASCRMFNKHPAAASCSPASSEPTISNKSCKSKHHHVIGLGNATVKRATETFNLVYKTSLKAVLHLLLPVFKSVWTLFRPLLCLRP